MTDLNWENINLNRITKKAWNERVVSTGVLLNAMFKIRRVITESSNNPVLEEQYYNYLHKYTQQLNLLSLVAPRYILTFLTDTVCPKIKFLTKKLDTMLVLLEKDIKLKSQFYDDLTRYVVADDIRMSLEKLGISADAPESYIYKPPIDKAAQKPVQCELKETNWADIACEVKAEIPEYIKHDEPEVELPVVVDKVGKPVVSEQRLPESKQFDKGKKSKVPDNQVKMF